MAFIIILSCLLIISASLNVYLFIKIRKSRKARPDTYEVKDLLQDLLAGSGYIKVTRISPTDFYLRSPR